MRVLLIKGDSISNVRVAKYVKCFLANGFDVSYWGWNRKVNENSFLQDDDLAYLLSGGGYGGRRLLFYYLRWMIKLFKRAFREDFSKYTAVIVINFDSALPIYLASKIKRINYIYEIHDEFALSYNFPSIIKSAVRKIDHALMRNSRFVVHVDSNRVSYKKCDSIVLENSPEDFYHGLERQYEDIKHQFAVIGNISPTRGIEEIIRFANNNRGIEFLVVGKFYDSELKDSLLSLPNLVYADYMPQEELYGLMKHCCGIFSLYDPKLEINRLAASNKVYDAMMMGIPVITNHEVINSSFIHNEGIGIVINYTYDNTWDILARPDFPQLAVVIGKKGRDLFLREYQFDRLVKERLINRIVGYETNNTRS